MIVIDRGNHQKLYRQLLDIIKGKIESGEWALGSQIPTEEELCRMYNVSKATVRNAVLELVRQGYLMRQQGKGTFIYRNTMSDGLTMQTTLKEAMLDTKLPVYAKVLAQTVMMPIEDLDVKLDISPDKHIIYIKRLHFIENKPTLINETYIPYHICPMLIEEKIDSQQIFDTIEKRHGIKITKVKNNIDIAYLTLNESMLLETNEGSAALVLMQYFYSGETKIMYSHSIKKIDRINLLMEFERRFV